MLSSSVNETTTNEKLNEKDKSPGIIFIFEILSSMFCVSFKKNQTKIKYQRLLLKGKLCWYLRFLLKVFTLALQRLQKKKPNEH